MGFGNFSSFGETDMIMRNSSTAGLQVYDIRNNQIINSNPMGTTGLTCQFSGVGNFSSRGTSDMIAKHRASGHPTRGGDGWFYGRRRCGRQPQFHPPSVPTRYSSRC
jgi:hypothetical protein